MPSSTTLGPDEGGDHDALGTIPSMAESENNNNNNNNTTRRDSRRDGASTKTTPHSMRATSPHSHALATPQAPQGADSGGGAEGPRRQSMIVPVNSGSAEDTAAAAEDDASSHQDYTKHPLLLTFNDAVIEAEYVHFVYSEGGGVGGKLYVVLAVILLAAVGLLFQKETDLPNIQRILDSWAWIGLWFFGVILAALFAIAMFVERLHKYREYILMAIIGTHWPSFQYANLTVRAPERYGYTFSVACYFFCTFISQPRVSRMGPFLSVTPLVTYIVVGSASDYFDTHTPFEVVLWPLMLFPLALLHSFEKVSRRNFEQRRRCNHVVERLQDQTAVTQSLVANFFAPTPTYLMLNSRKERNMNASFDSGFYANSASAFQATTGEKGKTFNFADGVAFIVTDLAGFTKWSSSQKPRAVINMVRGMFGQIDGVLGTFGVEKVATVGDAFIGASFPPVLRVVSDVADARRTPRAPEESPSTRAKRFVSALRFSLAILEFASNGLKMRVGLHVGGAVCGCFGTTPPKIDLLGDDFELAQLLEQTGTPGQVHASRAVLQAVKGQGVVIGASETEHGACFTGWDLVDQPEFDASGSPLPNAIDPETGNQIFTLAQLDEEDQDAFLMGGAEALNPVGRLKRAIADSALQVCELLAGIADDGAPSGGNRRGHAGSDDASGSMQAIDENELENLGLADDDGDTDDDDEDDEEEQEMSEASARVPLVHQGSADDMVSSIGHGSYDMGSTNVGAANDEGDAATAATKREPYDFSVIFLEFYRKRDERRYLRTARRSPLIHSACTVFAYLTTVLYIAHALLGCTESTQNRIVLAAMGGVLITHFFYLSRVGTAHKYNSFVIYGHYAVVTTLAIVGVRGDCNTHPQQELTSGNLLMLIYLMWSTAPQFLLNIPLKLRAVVIFVTAAIFCGLVAIRRAVIRDHAMEWDYLFGMEPIAILFASYFADYSQRRAFQSRMSLRGLLKSEAGRHAEFASRAMDVTLPRFVSERIVARLKAANADRADNSSAGSGQDDASSSYAPSAVSGTDSAATGNNVGDAKAGLLKVSAELVWDFPHVAVMFISFGDVADPVARLHELICTVEDAVGDLGVHKIKTIGTTVLCATGMRNASGDKKKKKNHGRDASPTSTGSPEEAVWSSVEAALAVAARLGPDNAAAMRCGIHIGHLVGAVVGAEGLMFDVFGDTVNTASRICTSCPPGSVRLSEPAALRLALLRDLDFAVAEEPTTVKVKGKGKMLVYDVNRLAPAARAGDEEHFSFSPNRSHDPAFTPPGGRSPTLRSPTLTPTHRSPANLTSALRSPPRPPPPPVHFEGEPMSPATSKRTRRVSIHRPPPVDTPAGELSSMDNSVLSPTPAGE